MQQVAPDTWRLGTRSHNFYVLRDGDVATLIDAGCSREWVELKGGLAEIGLTLDALAGIVASTLESDGSIAVPTSVLTIRYAKDVSTLDFAPLDP